MKARLAQIPGRQHDAATYPGPWPIDHLETALSLRDDVAIRHFLDMLMPLIDTHGTLAGVLCEADAHEHFLELLACGYWPAADRLHELLNMSIAAGSYQIMSVLLDLAAERGLVLEALATGWINAMARQPRSSPCIQDLHLRFPECVGHQAIACALEFGHAETLDTLLGCLIDTSANPDIDCHGKEISESARAPVASLAPTQQGAIGAIAVSCSDRLSKDTVTVLLARGLDPMRTTGEQGTLIEHVFTSASESVQKVLSDWVLHLPEGQAMNAYILMQDYEAFAANCCVTEGHCPEGFDAQAALITAVGRDHAAVAKVLLMLGADPNQVGPDGTLPLLQACHGGSGVCIDLLLKARVDPNLPQGDGIDCALTIAAARGDARSVLALLQAGADTTRFDGRGNTALHYCAARGDIELCARLLRSGLSIDTRSLSHGLTPLSMACMSDRHRGSHDVIRFLLDMGANVELRDRSGRTALDLADRHAQVDVARILRDRNARGLRTGIALRLSGLEDIPYCIGLRGIDCISGLVLATRRIMALLERQESTMADRTPDRRSLVDAGQGHDGSTLRQNESQGYDRAA